MNNRLILSLMFLTGGHYTSAFAGDDFKRLTPQDYITRHKEDAVRDMIKTGVPASITLAQGMFESENGNSNLARNANNHFGIKCHKEWNGPTYIQDDDEKNECFRKYQSVLESYDDHSDFLRSRDRYKFLFDYAITDYKNWARGLKKAGYATNPEYANKLIKIIEENNLNLLDQAGISASVNKPEPTLKPQKTKPTVEIISKPAPTSFVENHVPYVVAKKGDSWLSLAQQHEMMLWLLLKYNDADKNSSMTEGEVVYLKPKRNKTSADFHILREGETMRSVSQQYGIKLKQLYKRNHIEPYKEPSVGTRISLNKEL